jgi:hypothetical protein
MHVRMFHRAFLSHHFVYCLHRFVTVYGTSNAFSAKSYSEVLHHQDRMSASRGTRLKQVVRQIAWRCRCHLACCLPVEATCVPVLVVWKCEVFHSYQRPLRVVPHPFLRSAVPTES